MDDLEKAKALISDLVQEISWCSAWNDALDGEDPAMLKNVTAACEFIGQDIPERNY
jgi:hypothetical protein